MKYYLMNVCYLQNAIILITKCIRMCETGLRQAEINQKYDQDWQQQWVE